MASTSRPARSSAGGRRARPATLRCSGWCWRSPPPPPGWSARYFRSVAGSLTHPIRDNEIRVEFLGISVDRLIHLKLVVSGILAGIGGALAALAVQHVDPQMAYWTTSGGFVFVTILAGAGSVAAAFVGSLLFELVRSIAVDARCPATGR